METHHKADTLCALQNMHTADAPCSGYPPGSGACLCELPATLADKLCFGLTIFIMRSLTMQAG